MSKNLALRETLAELTRTIMELEETHDIIKERIFKLQERIDSIRAYLKEQGQ